MPNLDALTAAQLSQAAYPGNAPPPGWQATQTIATQDGANSFTVFVNSNTQQVVIGFKGSDNVSNFKSDLTDSGGSAWEAIKPLAQQALGDIQANYPGYQVLTDGHSLGGGMAQTFALENGLSGNGQNALPISQTAIDQDIVANGGTIATAIQNWSNGGNSFAETNMSGDPATLLYSTVMGQTYLPGTTTTIASPYAAAEVFGTLLAATGIGAAEGAAITGEAAAKAHSITTMVNALSTPPDGTNQGDTPATDSQLNSKASEIIGDYSNTAISVDAAGNISGQGTDGGVITLDSTATTAVSTTYALADNFAGYTTTPNTLSVATGAGAAVSQQGGLIGALDGATAVVNADGSHILTGSSSSLDLTGGGNIVTLGSANHVDVTNNTSGVGAENQVDSAGASNVVDDHGVGTVLAWFSNGSVSSDNSGELDVYGNNNNVSSSVAETIGIAGAGNTLTASNSMVYLSDDTSLNVYGNYDSISGGSNDALSITGIYDPVSATSSTIDYNGDSTGDTVSGSGDSGDDWGPGSTGGGYGYGGGYGGGYGYYGYYGFAGSPNSVKAAVGKNIGSIADAARSAGNAVGAAAAEKGRHEAALQAQLFQSGQGGHSAVDEAAHWDRQVVTWSLAAPGGQGSGAGFSAALDPSSAAAVATAFSAWSKQTGLRFEQVADSADSDIRIGLNDFDTATSGIAGYTTFQTKNGAMTHAAIHLENPAGTTVAGAASTQAIYAGTQASVLQVLEHEIGHAIGLASDADPHSIMFYQLTAQNRGLDQTDIAGVQALYGGAPAIGRPGSSTWAELDRVTQAMASFGGADMRRSAGWASNHAMFRATGDGHAATAWA